MSPERLFLAFLLVAAGWLTMRMITLIRLRRGRPEALEARGWRPGRPAVLYFTAPGCAPCQTIQEPALATLRERWGQRLQIHTIDATEEPHLADSWGVLSVPTTFLIDSRGRPRRVNNGPVGADKLHRQLLEIGESLPRQRLGEPIALEALE